MGNVDKVVIRETDGKCQAFSGNQKVFECPVSADPNKSLQILLEINSLKDSSGVPIYANYKYGDFYLWPMFQESLFWADIQPFVKYQKVIEWLRTNGVNAIETDITELASLFQLITKKDFSGVSWGYRLRVALRNVVELVFLHLNTLACALYTEIRGVNFLLYSMNSVWGKQWIDYRLKDLYDQLWKQSVRFLEGFYFPGFKFAFRRLIFSRRLAFYFPSFRAILVKHRTYRLGAVPEVPGDVLSQFVRKYESRMAATVVQAKRLKALFRILGIKTVIGIDEHLTHAAMVVTSKPLGIRLIGVQHGVFHKYSIGWICPGIPRKYNVGYDQILVWGAFWRDLLSELSNLYGPEQLIPAGFIRPSTVRFKPRQPKPLGNPLKILLPYEFLANPDEIADFVKAFLKRGYQIYFKVRFDDPLPVQLRLLPKDRLILISALTQEIIDAVDVCAGTSTTMMYELYYLGVPIWFLKTKHDSNIHMVEKGLAAEVTLDEMDSDEFDPARYIIVPRNPEAIFAPGGIPSFVVEHLKNGASFHDLDAFASSAAGHSLEKAL